VPNFRSELMCRERAVGRYVCLKSSTCFSSAAADVIRFRIGSCFSDKADACTNTGRTQCRCLYCRSTGLTKETVRSRTLLTKCAQAAQELARKVDIEIKEVCPTSGDNDLLIIVDTPSGDNVAKFALALGSQGNVRTRTARAWPQSEFQKLISELP
jgi:uncharacterized protein with GYD domain